MEGWLWIHQLFLTRSLLVLGAGFFAVTAGAQVSEAQRQFWIDLREAESQCKMSFVGGQGPLKVTGLSDTWDLRSPTGDLTNGDLRLQPKTANPGKLEVQVSGSPVNVSLFARQCQISIQNWRADLSVNLASGALTAQGKVGELKVWMSEGRATLNQVAGEVVFVGENAELQAEGGSGQWDLHSQQGAVGVQKFAGQLRLRLGQATGTLKGVEGSQRLEIHRGVAILQEPKGQIHVHLEEGQLRTSLGKDDVQMQVRSERGRTNVSLNGKGAWLDLITKNGDLVPASLGIKRVAGEKVAKGRLVGSASRTSVIVRSESGSVVVR